MSKLDYYAFAAFSRICPSLGVSLDMHYEIMSYYFWMPAKCFFIANYAEDRIQLRKVRMTRILKYGQDSWYSDFLEHILEFLMDKKIICTYGFVELDDELDLEIVLWNGESKFVSSSTIMRLLIDYNKITPSDLIVDSSSYLSVSFETIWK